MVKSAELPRELAPPLLMPMPQPGMAPGEPGGQSGAGPEAALAITIVGALDSRKDGERASAARKRWGAICRRG